MKERKINLPKEFLHRDSQVFVKPTNFKVMITDKFLKRQLMERIENFIKNEYKGDQDNIFFIEEFEDGVEQAKFTITIYEHQKSAP